MYCYNTKSGHLKMVKIADSWCVSHYSFSDINIFNAVRDQAVPMSYST